MLGLDSARKLINYRPYSVSDNNVLAVKNEDGSESRVKIEDPSVWTILLAQNPERLIHVTDDAVERYREIMDTLGTEARIQHTHKNYRKRVKYRLLHKSEGAGFLYSVRKPPPPEPILIPSDKEGLLRALIQSVAELRAGNENMRNIMVPLAQEAQRRNILPAQLLSPEEMTWVYA